jgi:hypothetical protein
MKTKHWYTAKEIATIGKCSIRTVERKRKSLIKEGKHNDWFRTNAKPYKYSYKLLSEFISTDLFKLIEHNRQLSRTIRCMHQTNTLEQHLSFLEWDYFITIAYKDNFNKKDCFDMMHVLYRHLTIPTITGDTRMFFTTESFTNRFGYHNHLILKSNCNKTTLEQLISSCLPYARIDIRPYNRELAGVFYVAKEGANGTDWDLLGNNLSAEGQKLLKNRIAS